MAYSEKLKNKTRKIIVYVLIISAVVVYIFSAIRTSGVSKKILERMQESPESVGTMITAYDASTVENDKEVSNVTEENENQTGSNEEAVIYDANISRPSLTNVVSGDSCNYTVSAMDATSGSRYKYFYYTGDYQTFIVPQTGYYTIEAWGANGGYARANGALKGEGGTGGYTYGKIHLTAGTTLYVYVGGKGTDAVVKETAKGGYNGGGDGEWDYSDDESAGGGGGSSDIRLIAGDWNDFNSLKSRIMVAAGGGGGSWTYKGGSGGGLEGSTDSDLEPGTQTSGYKFGIGQNATGGRQGSGDQGAGGAGGGYYGGTASTTTSKTGTGGSSFISGYEGCDAIDVASTEDNIIHTGQPIHYSGLRFTDASITYSGDENVVGIQKSINVASGDFSDGQVKISYDGSIDHEYFILDKRKIISVGDTYNLPTDYVGGWQYKSSNNDVARVEASGKIVGLSVGTTVVTAYNEDTGKKSRIIISVKSNTAGAITVPQVVNGESFTLILKEDGTVWRNRLKRQGTIRKWIY